MPSEAEVAAELKLKRLEAWRKRMQEQQQRSSSSSSVSSSKPLSEPRNDVSSLKMGPGFSLKLNNKKNAKRNLISLKLNETSFTESSDDEGAAPPKGKDFGVFKDGSKISEKNSNDDPPKQKRSRWDSTPALETDPSRVLLDGPMSMNVTTSVQANSLISDVDALDQFMDHLSAGAMGSVVMQDSSLSIDVGGSMIGETRQKQKLALHSGGTITLDDLTQLKQGSNITKKTDQHAVYGPSDWESETV